MATSRKPRGYWKTLKAEIRAQVSALGPMPTSASLGSVQARVLERMGEADHAIIANASNPANRERFVRFHVERIIVRNGNDAALRARLSPAPDWRRFENVEATIRAEAVALGKLPTAKDLAEHHGPMLYRVIAQEHGGLESTYRVIATRIDPEPKPPGYWDNIENVRRAFRSVK